MRGDKIIGWMSDITLLINPRWVPRWLQGNSVLLRILESQDCSLDRQGLWKSPLPWRGHRCVVGRRLNSGIFLKPFGIGDELFLWERKAWQRTKFSSLLRRWYLLKNQTNRRSKKCIYQPCPYQLQVLYLIDCITMATVPDRTLKRGRILKCIPASVQENRSTYYLKGRWELARFAHIYTPTSLS